MGISDINEQILYERYPGLLQTLLVDWTTSRNILWVTDDYATLGASHQGRDEITVAAITGQFAGIISPRAAKNPMQQINRTKEKAEVFTPSWLCNTQNNLVDEAWFGRRLVFNTEITNGWRTRQDKVEFPKRANRSWQKYVDEKRLEITCGEAPYLVSRYDTVTGEPISIEKRIGLLDRKMRIVAENTTSESDWLKWAERAFESVYGFELLGDSLLLARENLLISYCDYMWATLKRLPTEAELNRIALIISWNVWQMDGLTGLPPFQKFPNSNTQFGTVEPGYSRDYMSCQIRDWCDEKTVSFSSMLGKS